MPFQNPLPIDKSAFGNTGQDTVNLGSPITVEGDVNATITNASIDANVTGDVNATITNASIDANVTGDVNANITNANIDATVSGSVNANITNANIDATVNGNIVVDSGQINVGGIDTPVRVQGGGEQLLNLSSSVATSGTNIHNVPAPGDGLTYYGLFVFVQYENGGSLGDSLQAYVFNHGSFAALATEVSVLNPAQPNTIGKYGRNHQAYFIVPVTDTFPIAIHVSKFGGSATANYTVIARGIAHSLPHPIDGVEWASDTLDAMLNLAGRAVGDCVYFAPSFHDRRFRIGTHGAPDGNFVVEAMNLNGTWYETETWPQYSYFGGVVPTTTLNGPGKSEFIVPGNGRPHRLRVTVATTNFIRLSYAGKV